MSYCDSRDQDRGVCVCSLQLWIISTLFLLWPTCAERRMCPHESLFLFYFHCDSAGGGVGGGLLMVNLMLTWNCRSLLEIIRAIGDIHAVCFHGTCSRCDAALLNPSGGAFADCWRFTGNFHLPFVSSPWRRFFWSPWKTPISTLLHSLWNQFSLFCFYSLWVTMDTAPKWFGLSMNLFTSVNLEWIGMFFFFIVQPK